MRTGRLRQDSFYRHHSPEEIDLAFRNELDLDHPDAIDTELFVKVRRAWAWGIKGEEKGCLVLTMRCDGCRQCVESLKKGKATEVSRTGVVHPGPMKLRGCA